MTTVTQREDGRRARKKAATRRVIVETAIRLFGDHGIDAVTVDQIAVAADIGKGTIYNYFPTKEDIVVAFMVDLESQVQAQVQAPARAGRRVRHDDQRSVAAILIDFVQRQFQLKRRHHAFVRVFLGHMFMHTEQFLPHMVQMQKVIDPPLEALFNELRQRGRIRTDVDVAELVLVFKTVHLGLTALWAVEGPPFKQVSRVVERELTLFGKGLEVSR
jgi:AcrR family transcriptional regulator